MEHAKITKALFRWSGQVAVGIAGAEGNAININSKMLKGCSAMKIATWNINSIRLREQLVARLFSEEQPDILCLQEAADVFKFNDLTS